MSQGFRRKGRMPLRERMERNLAALKMQSHTGTNPFIEKFEAQLAALPPKRHRVKRPVDNKPALPLERDIQKACLQLLRSHPKVAFAYRINSGTFTEQNYDGSQRYISAHTMPGMSDLCAVLRGGRACFFEIKRPGQQATRLQQIFIDRASAAGALAAVISDPQQIIDILS